MDTREIRKNKLLELVRGAGGISALARKFNGVDPTYVSQLLNGHRSFGERSARNMETKMGLSAGWFDVAEEMPASTGHGDVIPIVEWPKTAGDISDSPRVGSIVSPVSHGDNAFALIVCGRSMESTNGTSFKPGDIIIIDPSEKPQNHDFVIAKNSGGGITFKQLTIEDGSLFLLALNPAWHPRITQTCDSDIVGPVICKIELFSNHN